RSEELHTQLFTASSMDRLNTNANEKNNAPTNTIKIGLTESPLTMFYILIIIYTLLFHSFFIKSRKKVSSQRLNCPLSSRQVNKQIILRRLGHNYPQINKNCCVYQ